MYQGKNGSTEHSKGNKTVPLKVATTRTEDGQKQTAKTGTEIQKEDGTQDDRRRDGGTNSTFRTKEQGMHLTLNEHHDYGLITVDES